MRGVLRVARQGREREDLIRFEHVYMTYDKLKYALKDVDLTIDDGEFVFVMGHSGAGKTTFTKLLLREEKVTSGSLFVDKYRLDEIPERQVPFLRRRMGFVFQDFRLFRNKTVYENVAFAMEILGEPTSEIRKKVPIALEIVGLAGKEKQMPNALSGGEKQRLCVARAIVNNPSVIVADEPTGNLDATLAREIMDLLIKISTFGKTVIVVTHAEGLVNQYDKRIIRLGDGEIVEDTKYPGKYGKTDEEKPDTQEPDEATGQEAVQKSPFVSGSGNENLSSTYTDFDADLSAKEADEE